jgi:hypothetical protein
MSPAEYQATQPHAQMKGGQWLWLWSLDSPSVPKAKKTRPSMDETWVNIKVEVKVEEVCADDGVYGTIVSMARTWLNTPPTRSLTC